MEDLVNSFQTVFAAHNLAKHTAKVLNKKKYKSIEEKMVFLPHEIAHCVTILHLLGLLLLQHDATGVPTVLWVDDAHNNNKKEREKAAKEYGIDFELVESTDEAISWLEDHPQFQNSSPAAFRIVTDWYRPDEGDNAASLLIQRTRAAEWTTPILIYCSERTDPSKVLANNSFTSSSSSDHLLNFFWASMKLTSDFTTEKKATGKKTTAAKKTAKKEEENDAEEEFKPAAKPKAKSAASKVAHHADDDWEDAEEPKPKAKITKAKSVGSKKTSAAEVEAPKPVVVSKKASTASTSTKTNKNKIAVDEEDEPKELAPTLDLTAAEEGDAPTLVTEETNAEKKPAAKSNTFGWKWEKEEEEVVLEKKSTDVLAPPTKSNVHEVLASRIPHPEEEEVPAPALLKSVTPSLPPPSAKSSIHDVLASRIPEPGSSAKSGASSKAGAKSTAAAKQLFDDDEEDDAAGAIEDGDEEWKDAGEKMDVDDDDFSPDTEEDEAPKHKTPKSPKAVSRQPTAEMTPNTKKKTDWATLLASRVPSGGFPPASPLSDVDTSNDHLLATPNTIKPKTSAAKKSNSSQAKSPTASKQNSDATPKTSPTKDQPVASPIPVPKPSAPMGPKPIKNLAILDDDDDSTVEDEERLPLFNKAPSLTSTGSNVQIVSAARSQIMGHLSKLEVGTVASFKILSKDATGRILTRGGAKVEVIFRNNAKNHQFDGFIVDENDGTYTVTAFPTRVGEYQIHAQLDGQALQSGPPSIEIVGKHSKKRTSGAASLDTSIDSDTGFLAPPAKKPMLGSLPDDDELEPTQIV